MENDLCLLAQSSGCHLLHAIDQRIEHDPFPTKAFYDEKCASYIHRHGQL